MIDHTCPDPNEDQYPEPEPEDFDSSIRNQNALNEFIGSDTRRVQIMFTRETRIDLDSGEHEVITRAQIIEYAKAENGGWWTSDPQNIGSDTNLGSILLNNNGEFLWE